MFCPAPRPPLQSLPLGLGRSGGGWDDVLPCSTSSSPILATGSINSFLSGCNSMDSGHETFHNAKVVIHDLGKRSQTVRGTRGVAHNLHVSRVSILVDTHDEHWSIS